jgi:hypothetical protein
MKQNIFMNSHSIQRFALFVVLALVVVTFSEPAHADTLRNIAGGFIRGIDNFLNSIGAGINNFFAYIGRVADALGLGWLYSRLLNFFFGVGTCGEVLQNGVGRMICNVVISTSMLPALISAIAYLMGLLFAITALFKLKEHVLNPDRTPLSDSIKRIVAGGLLFALPVASSTVKELLVGSGKNQLFGLNSANRMEADIGQAGGLDTMIVVFVADLWQPMQILFASFAYIAGLILVVVGISRLLKTAQEGPRGPAGLGTIMTFVTAGVLFSLDNIMASFQTSLFFNSTIFSYPVLDSAFGKDIQTANRVEGVVTAVIGFMALIGWISFIRGFFIMRQVAEGDNQASLMASITHIVAGALAVNMGALINAVQSTFGLTGFNVGFDF